MQLIGACIRVSNFSRQDFKKILLGINPGFEIRHFEKNSRRKNFILYSDALLALTTPLSAIVGLIVNQKLRAELRY